MQTVHLLTLRVQLKVILIMEQWQDVAETVYHGREFETLEELYLSLAKDLVCSHRNFEVSVHLTPSLLDIVGTVVEDIAESTARQAVIEKIGSEAFAQDSINGDSAKLSVLVELKKALEPAQRVMNEIVDIETSGREDHYYAVSTLAEKAIEHSQQKVQHEPTTRRASSIELTRADQLVNIAKY